MSTVKTKKKGLPLKLKLGWSSLGVSAAVSYTMIAYLSLYGTNVLGLDVGWIGIALMVSKIFDGISDVVVGFLIDKTHTRFGKARPYALAIVPYWICIALLFSAPELGDVGGIIYLFVMYTLANTVCSTLYACAEAPHMANALENPDDSLTLLSFGSVAAAFAGLVAGILLPQFVSAAGTDHSAWATMAWALAIPMAVLGIFRFLIVKEIRDVDTGAASGTQNRITFKEIIGNLIKNKYIFILAVLVFLSYFGSTLPNQVSSYYCQYILGDIGLGSILSLALVPLVIMMAIIPALARKFTLKKCINGIMIIGIVGSLLRLISPSSVALSFIAGCLYSVSLQAFYGFAGTMVIECMDYGEWKNGVRVEGVMGSAQSIMNKIGSGLGAAIAGVMLSAAGFDGTLEALPESATNMIIALTSVIPAIVIVVFLVVFHFYDLESKMPQIRQELKERTQTNA